MPRALRLTPLVAWLCLVPPTAPAQPSPPAAGNPAPAVLTSCGAVRALPHQDAARGLPVRVEGVVTLAPEDARGKLTLDDGTGIWVSPPTGSGIEAQLALVRPGDRLRIEGRTARGHFAPIIIPEHVVPLGRAPLPEPTLLPHLGQTSGIHDSQRVTLRGIVQAAEIQTFTTRQELKLVVSTDTAPFTFVLFGANTLTAVDLVDSEVSLTGVFLAYFNSRRQFLGARVYSNDPASIRILQPPPADAFAVPELSLANASGFSRDGVTFHRRRVRGTVTLSKPGDYFYLQEHPHALRVNTRQRDELRPGDIVEATGFLQLQHHRAEMKEAVFRVVGRQSPPVPDEIPRHAAFGPAPWAGDAPERDYDDSLIALRGRLVSVDHKQGEPLRLNLEVDDALVPAEFTGPADPKFIAALRPDSLLRVTGICAITFSESLPVVNWPTPVALRLLLRDIADVEVIAAASWWTQDRLVSALALAAVVLLLALAWVAMLRRQVARRSEELAEAMRARRDAAVEFDSTLRERNRLAADLHDTTEQALTGMALQLEAADALRTRAPERSEQHLGLARHLLDRSREDLRRSIWNLRANPLEQHTLAEALREVAADRSAGLGIAIEVASRGEERPMPDFVAGNLLLLAQEGITNALKHAAPTRIDLQLEFTPQEITLAIRDDGRGFDPATAEGPKDGHFGLQGMRERVKRLGGRLTLRSAPGRGTTITATVRQ